MRLRLVALLGLLLLAGCGSREQPLVPIAGQVMYQGKPLSGGTIVFCPDRDRGCSGCLSCAVLNAEGRFEIDSHAGKGAAAGWHRVTVAGPAGQAIPGRYCDPELSGQRVEVKAGSVNFFSLHLE